MTDKKIPVFKVGKHTDSNGNTREWSEADVKNIVEKYDGKTHTAPVVIGHPTSNAPAYGWVGSLEYGDGIMYASLTQLNNDFVEAVKSGAYKKRSISLYPDGSLRHIGFLGATPPAIKGLEDVSFSEGESTTIEFEESTTSANVFEFADVMAQKDAALEEREAQIAALQKEIKTKEDEQTRISVESFVDEQIAAGRLLQTQRDLVVNIGILCKKVRSYDFSEAEKKSADEFEELIKTIPVRVEFKEFATHDKASNNKAIDINDRDALHKAALSFAEENSVGYPEALNKIIQGAKTDGD